MLEQTVRVQALDGFAELAVKHLASMSEPAVIGHFLQEGLPEVEDVRRYLRLGEQTFLDKLMQGGGQILRFSDHLFQQHSRELLPDDRRRPQHRLEARSESVDTGSEEGFHGRRHTVRPRLQQRTCHLFEEERVATGTVHRQRDQHWWELITGQTHHQSRGFGGREWAKQEVLARRAHDGLTRGFGPVSKHE